MDACRSVATPITLCFPGISVFLSASFERREFLCKFKYQISIPCVSTPKNTEPWKLEVKKVTKVTSAYIKYVIKHWTIERSKYSSLLNYILLYVCARLLIMFSCKSICCSWRKNVYNSIIDNCSLQVENWYSRFCGGFWKYPQLFWWHWWDDAKDPWYFTQFSAHDTVNIYV